MQLQGFRPPPMPLGALDVKNSDLDGVYLETEARGVLYPHQGLTSSTLSALPRSRRLLCPGQSSEGGRDPCRLCQHSTEWLGGSAELQRDPGGARPALPPALPALFGGKPITRHEQGQV